MTTFTKSVTTTGDDGYYDADTASWNTGSTGQMSVGSFPTTVHSPGFRFRSITIPQGQSITSATITLNQKANGGTSAGTWYAWANDNAPVFSTGSNPTNVTKTTASAAWVNTASGTTIPVVHTITTIAQEILNRGGWASGNAMNFMFIPSTSGSNNNLVDSVDTTSGTPALLTINYGSAPAGNTTNFFMFM